MFRQQKHPCFIEFAGRLKILCFEFLILNETIGPRRRISEIRGRISDVGAQIGTNDLKKDPARRV